tara:strand:+ start:1818 stop:2072 length:255 start_codon:yes stop_codon:yes gene_type:complete
MRKPRVLFEQALTEKMQRLRNKVEAKQKEKQKRKEDEKKKGFAKFYKMSYNELRQEARELKVSTWRKTKEDLIEELIQEYKRLH